MLKKVCEFRSNYQYQMCSQNLFRTRISIYCWGRKFWFRLRPKSKTAEFCCNDANNVSGPATFKVSVAGNGTKSHRV